jgi:hypothetical protein
MARVSGEQKTNNLHTNRLGSSVKHSSGPKESLPICLAHERPSTHVTATNPCVDVLQYSTSFVWCDAFHQSAISTTPEELVIY